ncbi:DUF6390 family protein [Streptomyces sp. NBC_01754]|uniref:DUF6390 family protein n=1 Tax=Streptomyces sp. NBC_01754 TaxID=2975930 RepID=UPI002DD9B75A|nr:DUF6390 family protein [Streptomyces sp. NBC_01754]WSC96262.1 DUF6390 family protein [Streptomyces sp. NBC_01754]
MSAEGALLFARYAYPPNELGYCGPEDASALLRTGATEDIERRARRFEGAWCYLEFLAERAGIADPLDARVVEAYWIGNELLERADSAVLLDRMADRFRGQLGGTWRQASGRALAHHSFQVFEVYPWAALLGGGGHPTAVGVLDRCRIRTARVLRVEGGNAAVRSSPLTWDGETLVPGPEREELVRWSAGGRTLIDALAPGDRVTVHWDWVCDVVTEEQAARVEALEARQRGQLWAPAGAVSVAGAHPGAGGPV